MLIHNANITGSLTVAGNSAITGSLTVSGTITGTVAGTTATASYVEYANVANKPALVSGSAQVAAFGYATTSSNTFQGSQVVTGSLFISQNLIVAGSSSIQYISSSVLDIADNIITVNAFNPSVRFGGLGVIDSGSSPQRSGSILFDSISDQWIFVHQNQTVITSSVLLMGPETYNDLGNETYISANRLPKGSGIEHLRDSNITDTGTQVSVNSNTIVTGSFTVVTGSAIELQVTNTGVRLGNALTDVHNVTGSLQVSGSLQVRGTSTFTGNLSGTTATFLSDSSSTIGLIVGGAGGAGSTRQGQLRFGDAGTVYKIQGGEDYSAINFMIGAGTPLTIASSGNVGINETNPVAGKLSIKVAASASNQSGFDITNAVNASFNVSLRNDITEIIAGGTGNLLFSNGGGERVRITSGGNVLIGTTTDNGARLQVSGAATFSSSVTAGGTFISSMGNNSLIFNSSLATTGFQYATLINSGASMTFGIERSTGGALSNGSSAYASILQTSNSTNLQFGTANNIRMTIDSSGNVGIGTASPSQVLDVQAARGAITTTSTTGTNTSYLQVNNTGGTLNIGIDSSTGGSLFGAGGYTAGMWHSGAYPLTFGTSNTERVRITSGGNVGIGTTSPGKSLEIYKAGSSTSQLKIGDASTAKGYLGMFSNALYINAGGTFDSGWSTDGSNGIAGIVLETSNGGSAIAFGTAASNTSPSERLRITSGGNVGIGTTSPSVLFHVNGSGTIGRFQSSVSYVDLSFINSTSSNGFIQYNGNNFNFFANSGSTPTMTITGGAPGNVGIGTSSPNARTVIATTLASSASFNWLTFRNLSSGYGTWGFVKEGLNGLSLNYGTDSDTPNVGSAITFAYGGNVGIGTTSPGSILETVAGSNGVALALRARALDDTYSQINFLNNSGNNNNAIIGVEKAGTNGGLLYFYTKPDGGGIAERMRITSGGSVYINTSTNQLANATPQFQILAGASTDAVSIRHTQDGNNSVNIWQTGNTSHSAIAFYKGNTQDLRGTITVTTSGTTYNSTSDYRLKENILPLENGLDRLMQLKPSKFNWIENGNESEGFIAHELQSIFPDAVTGEKDEVYSSTGNIKPQSVDYGRITPLLVKAIQELKAENDNLKSRIEALEA